MYRDKECLVCLKVFSPKNSKGKTCSDLCGRELRRFRERERDRKSRPELEKVCPFCGSSFLTRDSKRKVCFTPECNYRSVYEKNKRSDEKRKGLRGDYSRERYYANQEQLLARKRLSYRLNADREVRDGISTFKLNFSAVKEYFRDLKYSIHIDEKSYINTHQKLPVTCPDGHNWEITYHNFKSGQRCPRCQVGLFQSRPERELVSYFRDNYPEIVLIERDRSVGCELDLFFPENKVAIEYCGLHWHGEIYGGKGPGYHRNKMDLCLERGIRLITVFEDEYLERKQVVLSRIEASLGLIKWRIFARKCAVKEISAPEAKIFLEANHLQGSVPAKIRFGLYYEGQLVQVLSLGGFSRNHTSIGPSSVELKRLASLSGCEVVGGASRLFSYAVQWAKENGYKSIKSYCDLRWANHKSDVYSKLGFVMDSETSPSPFYFKGQCRYHIQGLRKTPEERVSGKTEWELRREQGYDRIWDCGYRRYIYDLNK